MKKSIWIAAGFIVLLLILAFLFFGIPRKINSEEGSEATKQEGLITESLNFDNSNVEGKITKNKLTNTATTDIKFLINDSEEYSDFGETKISAMPLMVRLSCGLFAVGFYNQSALDNMKKRDEMSPSTNRFREFSLENYTIESVSLTFLDEETNEKIAECTSTGAREEDIEINMYRNYSNLNQEGKKFK